MRPSPYRRVRADDSGRASYHRTQELDSETGDPLDLGSRESRDVDVGVVCYHVNARPELRV